MLNLVLISEWVSRNAPRIQSLIKFASLRQFFCPAEDSICRSREIWNVRVHPEFTRIYQIWPWSAKGMWVKKPPKIYNLVKFVVSCPKGTTWCTDDREIWQRTLQVYCRVTNFTQTEEGGWVQESQILPNQSNVRIVTPQTWHDAPIHGVIEHTIGLLSHAQFHADRWRGGYRNPQNLKYWMCSWLFCHLCSDSVMLTISIFIC